MTFGGEGLDGARVHDLKDVEAILDVFQAHGHSEVRPSALASDNNNIDHVGATGCCSWTQPAYTQKARPRNTSARLGGRRAGS